MSKLMYYTAEKTYENLKSKTAFPKSQLLVSNTRVSLRLWKINPYSSIHCVLLIHDQVTKIEHPGGNPDTRFISNTFKLIVPKTRSVFAPLIRGTSEGKGGETLVRYQNHVGELLSVRKSSSKLSLCNVALKYESLYLESYSFGHDWFLITRCGRWNVNGPQNRDLCFLVLMLLYYSSQEQCKHKIPNHVFHLHLHATNTCE